MGGGGQYITFGVVQYALDEDRVLCNSLCDQQDALLDAMPTQQRPPTGTLSMMGWRTETLTRGLQQEESRSRFCCWSYPGELLKPSVSG